MWCGVQRDKIELVWPLIEDLVQDALNVIPTHESKDVFEALISGNMQLWVCGEMGELPELICITQICEYPAMSSCCMFLTSGTNVHRYWELHEEVLIPWAKAQGCSMIEGRGRPGWANRAKKEGWTASMLYTREI